MKKLVCNYAPLRFLPYRETGEFVNLGIVLQCPQTDFFGFRLVPARKFGRVSHFFPELQSDLFKKAIKGTSLKLDHIQNKHRLLPSLQMVDEATAQRRVLEFAEFVRIREGLIHFGETQLILHQDPEQALDTLFERYVERQYAQKKEYQETVMRNRLAQFLQQWKLNHFYRQNETIGDAEFKVTMPFVHFENETPVRAVKPLDLDKDETTEIYDHGGIWVNRLARLKERKRLPRETLFAVRMPESGNRQKAANKIIGELTALGVLTVPFADQQGLYQRVRQGLIIDN